MFGNKNFDEYHTALEKITKYAIEHEIQYSCDGRSETYYIKNKLVVTAKPPVSKSDKAWPWKILPKPGQHIYYEARLNGKILGEKLAPQWIFHFLKEQRRLQIQKMTIVSTRTAACASA